MWCFSDFDGVWALEGWGYAGSPFPSVYLSVFTVFAFAREGARILDLHFGPAETTFGFTLSAFLVLG